MRNCARPPIYPCKDNKDIFTGDDIIDMPPLTSDILVQLENKLGH